MDVNQDHTILVVDDETDVVAALESMLADRGYIIRQATRWTEAIAEIQDHRPDAVLLDLYLPNVQGEALLEFIRDLDPHLPVVIVSSEIETSKLDQLGRLGANGFVRKPFSEDDLFLVVEQILSEATARADRRSEEDVKTAVEPEVPVPSPEPEPEPSKIDPGAGIERLERARPEIDVSPPQTKRRSQPKRRGRRKGRMRNYMVAFFICLFGTWALFMAQEMLSQGFFGIDISGTREDE